MGPWEGFKSLKEASIQAAWAQLKTRTPRPKAEGPLGSSVGTVQESEGNGARHARIQLPVLPLPGCVTLGQWLNLSVLPSVYMEIGIVSPLQDDGAGEFMECASPAT